MEALQNAKTVRAEAETQEEIDAAVLQLNTAWLNLRLKADESLVEALRGFVTMTLSLNEADFSAENWGVISMARNTIQTALEQHDAGTKELSAADAEELKALMETAQNVIDGKQDAPEENKKPADNTADKKDEDTEHKASTDLPDPLVPANKQETERAPLPLPALRV